MTATITATNEDQTFTVDLGKVNAFDALAYRLVTGEDLDPVLGRFVSAGTSELLADVALIKWLWTRQNVDPAAHLVTVFQTVTLLPVET